MKTCESVLETVWSFKRHRGRVVGSEVFPRERRRRITHRLWAVNSTSDPPLLTYEPINLKQNVCPISKILSNLAIQHFGPIYLEWYVSHNTRKTFRCLIRADRISYETCMVCPQQSSKWQRGFQSVVLSLWDLSLSLIALIRASFSSSYQPAHCWCMVFLAGR